MDSQGLILCAKYSSAPNFFGYCGPPKNSTLVDHLREMIGDKEVENILSQFDTLYLNLKLIAFENKIKDPFNRRVVEAYWIGNDLLNNIKSNNYIALLEEKFELKRKIGSDKFLRLKYKFLSNQALPHHSFHVFNIFKRTGHINSDQTIETMDNCRIGWGVIKKLQITNYKLQIKSKIQKIIVDTKKLSINIPSTTSTTLSTSSLRTSQLLSLNKPTIKELKIDYRGKSFLDNLKVGDWVSFHWGFVCDKLKIQQINNLEFYTSKAINFFNATI